MPNALFRRDAMPAHRGCRVVWAWHSHDFKAPLREGMLLLYGLTPEGHYVPQLNAPGMTHEFSVYEIDPQTPIDFETSLFEQKEISPITPATMGYQFVAPSDVAAIDRMEALVKNITHDGLYVSDPEKWAALFVDGVPSNLDLHMPEGIDLSGIRPDKPKKP